MEFTTASGAQVMVEADGQQPGAKLVSRGGNSLVQAGRTLDEALVGIRSAAETALTVFREGPLSPDGVELEFGVKLTAEAGAVIARTTVEGQLTVRLSWAPGARTAADSAQGGAAGTAPANGAPAATTVASGPAPSAGADGR